MKLHGCLSDEVAARCIDGETNAKSDRNTNKMSNATDRARCADKVTKHSAYRWKVLFFDT